MIDTPNDEPVRFSLADVDSFAEASHDTNPLHTSEAYAHPTPFGRRVVHGMLAAIACLGRLPERPAGRIARLQIDFKSPLFADVSYRVEIAEKGARATIRLFDGARVALRIVAEFTADDAPSIAPRTGSAPRTTPARARFADLPEGWEREGSYGCAETAIALAARFGALPIAILMASSYLVGMEAPGEAALFCRAVIAFDRAPAPLEGALAFRLAVTERDDRFDLLRMHAAFAIDGVPVAGADLEAFVRPDPTALDADLLRRLSPPRGALAGRSAIVVGGSRGLGAAIALALADQGARVGLCYARSRDAAERVAALAPPGRVTLLEADAADAAAFEPAARAFAAENGLDLLVCNACPALGSLSLDPRSLPRVLEYVDRSVALVAIPLASTLDLLSARRGDLVVISSIAVDDPPPEWPHYVAAKAAVEALARAALAGARGLRGTIVRPPRLRTDLVGTPGSHEHALAPEVVAARLVSALAEPHAPGVTLLQAFG